MTYTYSCTNNTCSKKEFTLDRSIKDNPLEICPTCGSKVNQVFKPIGIIINTSGFCGKIHK